MHEFFWEKNQYHLQDDMIDWCKKNIGCGGWYSHICNIDQLKQSDQWGCWWLLGSGRFVFRTEDQLKSFIEVWSDK